MLALAETHYRQDVPRERFQFSGYKVWHADRGGMDKVSPRQTTKSYFIIQGGGGMSVYYLDHLQVHEHHPNTPAQYKYLDNERQWLLVQSAGQKIAFLR